MFHRNWSTILGILLILFESSLSYVNVKLVRHFLMENYIKTALYLSCSPVRNVYQLQKDAQSLHVYTSSVDIGSASSKNFDYERFFRYFNHRVAVVADLECPTISSVLDKVSNHTYFHQRYFWLIFAQSVRQSEALLGVENINVDAEITVAIPVPFSSQVFERKRMIDV